MKRIRIENSSQIHSVGYDSKNQILEIEFVKGGIYQYQNVPIGVYTGLKDSISPGKYFHANIRNEFRYVKIS